MAMKYIELTQGKVAIVDDELFDWLDRFKWRASLHGRNFYAVRNAPRDAEGKRTTIKMHRVIAGATITLEVDHKNGNGLDNRRQNLRLCTKAENQRNKCKPSTNSSGVKGVTWDKARNNFQARIKFGGKNKFLGRYDTACEAGVAYDAAAVKLYGKFARTNTAINASSMMVVAGD